jgi:hypothetical protein
MLHQTDNVMLFVPLDALPRDLASNTERVVRFDGRSPRAQLNDHGPSHTTTERPNRHDAAVTRAITS